MSGFKGWAAFSVYGVEGEEGTIYLSAHGVAAGVPIESPVGRVLLQLSAIQREAADPAPTPTDGADPLELDRLEEVALGGRQALVHFLMARASTEDDADDFLRLIAMARGKS